MHQCDKLLEDFVLPASPFYFLFVEVAVAFIVNVQHERLEMMQSIKETREKRSFTMLQLLISLAAIVIVVFLLRDNPTVLVNILYIVGIIIVLWILKGPHEKNPFKEE